VDYTWSLDIIHLKLGVNYTVPQTISFEAPETLQIHQDKVEEIFNRLVDCSRDRLAKGLPNVGIASGLGILDICIILRNSIARPQLGHT
jgi:hypothetical protein